MAKVPCSFNVLPCFSLFLFLNGRLSSFPVPSKGPIESDMPKVEPDVEAPEEAHPHGKEHVPSQSGKHAVVESFYDLGEVARKARV